MAIELSSLTFTNQADIVPASGVEQIFNTGIANTLAGDDIITGTTTSTNFGIRNEGSINTDDGNDIITGTGYLGIYNTEIGSIDTGKGNDTITGNGDNTGIFNPQSGGIIDTGDGNDIITGTAEFGITNTGIIDTGNGNDIITGISNKNFVGLLGIYQEPNGIINTGADNDSIISKGNFTNRGNVFLGEGNDLIAADRYLSDGTLENFGFIGTGDGNDIITTTGVIYNEGIIETGNGDDSIIVDGGVDDLTGTRYGIYNNRGAINMGDGSDSIIANEGFQSGPNSGGAWFLGEGDDYIKGYGSGDFYGGNGTDTLELTSGTYTVGIWGDAGESPIFTKGNQLMITSEFEKLKVGSTIYDFTSLTAGQIIFVA